MSSPVPNATPEEARTRVCKDHELLRDLTRKLEEVARSALGNERQRSEVRRVLGELCRHVEQLFAFEESVLLALLREADAWGPVRVEQIVREHEEQRTILLALAEDAEDAARSTGELADELLWFARRFSRDMAEEEARFLTPEALGEEVLVVDQIDG